MLAAQSQIAGCIAVTTSVPAAAAELARAARKIVRGVLAGPW